MGAHQALRMEVVKWVWPPNKTDSAERSTCICICCTCLGAHDEPRPAWHTHCQAAASSLGLTHRGHFRFDVDQELLPLWLDLDSQITGKIAPASPLTPREFSSATKQRLQGLPVLGDVEAGAQAGNKVQQGLMKQTFGRTCPWYCTTSCTARSEAFLRAATLPLDLLAAVLQTACKSADWEQQQELAKLVQLASVCRHWQKAAGLASQHMSPMSLPCSSLTPALQGWAKHWTGLDLWLNKHGVPPALKAFMGSTTALAKVTLQCSRASNAADVAAVSQALVMAPAIQEARVPVSTAHCLPRFTD